MFRVLFLTFVLCLPCWSQLTTVIVTGTVRDGSGNAYAGGSGRAVLVSGNNSGNQNWLVHTTNPVPNPVIIYSLDSSGAFSMSLTMTSAISPASAQPQWRFQFCASDGVTCFTMTPLSITVAQDISAQIQAQAASLPLSTSGCGPGNCVTKNPSLTQTITQPVGTSLALVGAVSVSGIATLSGGGAFAGIFSGNPAFTGVPTTGNLNNIRYVDGTKFGPDWAAGITAADTDCGANPCTIVVSNKAGLSSTLAPTVTWANGRCVVFDAGTFNLSVGWTIAPVDSTNNVCLIGTPATTLNFTGSAGFLIDGTGVGNGATVYMSRLLFNGNAGITNLVTFKKMARSHIEYLRARNCTGTAILCQFCVNNLFIQPKVTSNDGAFTTQPTNGIVFDWITASGNATDDVTVLSPETAGLSGDGIKLDHASEVRILGGESNTNAIGLEIAGDHISTGTRNIIDGMHFEVNTVNDLKIDGFRNTLRDLTASASAGIDNLIFLDGNAIDNYVIGGLYNRINIATNATRTSFYDVQYNGLGTGSFTNNGTSTTKLGVKNATSGVIDGNLFPESQTATNFTSTATTGTQPFAATSTTLNTNLNADMVDGFHAGTAATGHAMCWKDATHMGNCSTTVDASGLCTCN